MRKLYAPRTPAPQHQIPRPATSSEYCSIILSQTTNCTGTFWWNVNGGAKWRAHGTWDLQLKLEGKRQTKSCERKQSLKTHTATKTPFHQLLFINFFFFFSSIITKEKASKRISGDAPNLHLLSFSYSNSSDISDDRNSDTANRYEEKIEMRGS